MAERMSFILDGRDQLTRVLNGAGDSANRLHRRISAATTNSSTAIDRLATRASDRLRSLRSAFTSSSDGAGQLQAGAAGVTGALGDLGGAAAGAGAKLGASGGGLGPVMGGVAAIAGLSLLPALGALVPMMAGAGVAAGTLSLGFKGVGDAVEASGKSKKEYAAALKKLGPEARMFTKELVGLKREFGGLGKDIQKAMLPGFTEAVRSAGPVVKILGRSMTEMGKGFGDAAAGAGRLMSDSGFKTDFTAVLKLGGVFVKDLTTGIGGLARGFLSFGAASGPTLRVLSGGIRDLLGKGLPGMFKGLETGIGGSAKFLSGLFGMINRVLPALGRFAGEVANTFGPLLGEVFERSGRQAQGAMDGLGTVVRWLAPLFKELAFGVKASYQFFDIIGPTIRETAGAIVGALAPAFGQLDGARGPLQRLSDSIKDNKQVIQEVARVGGNAFIDLVSAGVTHLPTLISVFRTVTGGMVTAMGGVLHAAASAFGWIPGIGDKLKSADRSFGRFKSTYLNGLATAEKKTRDFAAATVPRLEQGKLKMNISNWESQIKTAKGQLKTVPPSKRAALLANISNLQRNVAQAKRDMASVQGKTVTVRTHYVVSGNTARKSGSAGSQLRFASGGLVGYPGGGMVRGAGTGTSDSILAMVSNGEYVVKAKSVAQYGVRFLAAINEGRLGMAAALGSGGGGSMGGAGQEVGRGLSAGMAASGAGVEASARGMAGSVLAGIRGELEIASPSKRTAALAKDAGKGLIVGLTGSREKIKATAKDLAKDIWAAFTGSKDNRLVAAMNKQVTKLLSAASKRDSIAATIKRAKDFAETTRVGAKSSASLGSMFGGDQEQVTAGGIKGKLAAKLAKMRTFSRYISTLAKRGLNKTMLREILSMGPEDGYAYASALVGMDKGTFASVNSTQYAINAEAEKLGRKGADALYDSGKNSGKGFLKGLEGQQKDIEALMMRIAKGMQKSIRKALGINSPARKLIPDGVNAVRGLALGVIQGVPHLDQALGVVTDRVAGTRPVIGGAAVAGRAGGGSGGSPMHVTITVNSMDPVATGREIRRMLLELKRTQGLNVSLGVS